MPPYVADEICLIRLTAAFPFRLETSKNTSGDSLKNFLEAIPLSDNDTARQKTNKIRCGVTVIWPKQLPQVVNFVLSNASGMNQEDKTAFLDSVAFALQDGVLEDLKGGNTTLTLDMLKNNGDILKAINGGDHAPPVAPLAAAAGEDAPDGDGEDHAPQVAAVPLDAAADEDVPEGGGDDHAPLGALLAAAADEDAPDGDGAWADGDVPNGDEDDHAQSVALLAPGPPDVAADADTQRGGGAPLVAPVPPTAVADKNVMDGGGDDHTPPGSRRWRRMIVIFVVFSSFCCCASEYHKYTGKNLGDLERRNDELQKRLDQVVSTYEDEKTTMAAARKFHTVSLILRCLPI